MCSNQYHVANNGIIISRLLLKQMQYSAYNPVSTDKLFGSWIEFECDLMQCLPWLLVLLFVPASPINAYIFQNTTDDSLDFTYSLYTLAIAARAITTLVTEYLIFLVSANIFVQS